MKFDSKKNYFDSIIIGGGAAGLFCAYQLAKKNFNVLLIEKNDRLARKIQISGGGKCNFTNLNIKSNNYQSQNSNFCKPALKEYTSKDFINLIKENHIEFYEKKLGQLFCKNSATDIINMLLNLCKKTGRISILKSFSIDNPDSVIKYQTQNNNFYEIIESKHKSFFTNNLVIASGGLSIPTIGASPIGYQIAKKFHMKIIETIPALVGLKSNERLIKNFQELSGVSIKSKVTFEKKSFIENVLFTHKGLSGPSILQISLYWDHKKFIGINFLPDYNLKTILDSANQKNKISKILKEYLPNKFIDFILKYLNIDPNKSLSEISKKSKNTLINTLQNFQYTPIQTEGMRKAEVTKGGVCTKELDPKTFESKKNNGLYFIGEVIDVTGELGGFNFQWAWSSAFSCAKYMKKSIPILKTDIDLNTKFMDESCSQEQQSHQISLQLKDQEQQRPL